MKGLLLSGGHGTRLRPITYSQQKQLIPVANKPILFYAIEDLIEAGIREIGIIIGGPNKDQVIDTVKASNWEAEIKFIYQDEPKGLAHAILVAEEFLDEDFVMYLGDNILREGIVEHAKKFKENNYDASIMLTEVENPQQFGVADIKKDGSIRLVEKPAVPPSNLALIGVYFFKPIVFESCKSIKPSWRNELEITDTIQWLIDNNYKVGWTKIEGWWKDTGKPEDILEANRLVLDDIKMNNEGTIKGRSRIIGRVTIGKGAKIENSLLKGPSLVGENCLIKNSYVGPYTSIGMDCIIEDTEIEDSIIMQKSEISGGGRIIESLIGKEVKIKRKTDLPSGKKVVVGDNSELIG